MLDNSRKNVVIVTGAAGFIGFHIAKRLLDVGCRVVGFDCLSDYYDISLKESREKILMQDPNYRSIHSKLEDQGVLRKIFQDEKPDFVFHMAAQAGVRQSLDSPRTYLESNVVGTFELLEAARAYPPKHMLLASTSSIYGANNIMPYKETDRADYQMSFYAATKKSTENIAHSYSYLFNLPITIFRFFTVYGPWGRPDMALFKFTTDILNGNKVKLYNYGNMTRDFTYIDDLVKSVCLLMNVIPKASKFTSDGEQKKSKNSPVAPFSIINIGKSKPEKLTDFIKIIEKSLGLKANIDLVGLQPGDLSATWADTEQLKSLTGYRATTDIKDGIENFIKWYKDY